MTLVPRPRLLAALIAGSVLFLLLLLSPVFIIVPLLYYAAMGALILADSRRLPRRSGFMASRVLPQPFSLGEVQAVQVLVAHGDAAGFPNGRRVFDDIVAVELRAVAGATIPLVDPSYHPDAAAGLLTQWQQPSQEGNGPAQGSVPGPNRYQAAFPYLGDPLDGYDVA